ncbi:MAG: hypothetical protein ACP5IE_06215 [Infirmifilum sp.]
MWRRVLIKGFGPTVATIDFLAIEREEHNNFHYKLRALFYEAPGRPKPFPPSIISGRPLVCPPSFSFLEEAFNPV